jgi:hypothetical protein
MEAVYGNYKNKRNEKEVSWPQVYNYSRILFFPFLLRMLLRGSEV